MRRTAYWLIAVALGVALILMSLRALETENPDDYRERQSVSP